MLPYAAYRLGPGAWLNAIGHEMASRLFFDFLIMNRVLEKIQSVITKLPRLTQQGQQIGALVGEKLAKEASENSCKRVRQKGYQL